MNIFFSTYYKLSKYLSSIVLLAGMLALLSLIGWLLAGSSGIALFLPGGVFIFISALRITPRLILRLHQAKSFTAQDAPLQNGKIRLAGYAGWYEKHPNALLYSQRDD